MESARVLIYDVELFAWSWRLTSYLLCISMLLHLLYARRTAAVVLAWLVAMYALPKASPILYHFLDVLKLGSRRSERLQRAWLELCRAVGPGQSYHSERFRALFALCDQGQLPPLSVDRLQIFSQSDEIFSALCESIDQAEHQVDMLFYMWQPGGPVDAVSLCLMRAVARGVRCRLLLDEMGSKHFLNSVHREILAQAGVEIVPILPVRLRSLFSRRIDLRQHRKLVVIDNRMAYTGSMNMVDPQVEGEYYSDLFIRFEGEVVLGLAAIFSLDWRVETLLPCTPLAPPCLAHSRLVQTVISGPCLSEALIYKILLSSIYAARSQIIIAAPYFVPSESVMLGLVTAAQRGVQVQLILPARGDTWVVQRASGVFFKELLAAGVEIYHFEAGVLHTKALLIDQQLSLFGSVNLDSRSFFLNFELLLLLEDPDCARHLLTVLTQYIAASTRLSTQKCEGRSPLTCIVEKLCYCMSPLL